MKRADENVMYATADAEELARSVKDPELKKIILGLKQENGRIWLDKLYPFLTAETQKELVGLKGALKTNPANDFEAGLALLKELQQGPSKVVSDPISAADNYDRNKRAFDAVYPAMSRVMRSVNPSGPTGPLGSDLGGMIISPLINAIVGANAIDDQPVQPKINKPAMQSATDRMMAGIKKMQEFIGMQKFPNNFTAGIAKSFYDNYREQQILINKMVKAGLVSAEEVQPFNDAMLSFGQMTEGFTFDPKQAEISARILEQGQQRQAGAMEQLQYRATHPMPKPQ
jgi:hypothetical protein